jgi:hypothetical protein
MWIYETSKGTWQVKCCKTHPSIAPYGPLEFVVLKEFYTREQAVQFMAGH